MKEFFKKSINYSIGCSLLFLITGIVMFFKPIFILNWSLFIIETLLIITGISIIINYIRSEKEHEMFSYNFTYGVVCILLSLFLILNPKTVISILPVIMGIWMVIGSLIRLQFYFTIKENKHAIIFIIAALTMFTCGIAIICNPFEAAGIIIQSLGGIIFIYSTIDILSAILIKKQIEQMF